MSFWHGQKVLVAGGASFIGSHLVDRLVVLGAETRVADDLSSGKSDNLNCSLNHLELLQGDLRDSSFADRACAEMEVVFQLAAAHGGRGYIDSHPADCANNMALDGSVFAAAQRAGVERICYASSACVYPMHIQDEQRDGKVYYLREDMAGTSEPGKAAPDGEYGWAKLMGELSLQAYSRQYGLKTAPCRIHTAYGERENETHAIIAWIARAFVRQDPFVIWGSGQQARNYIYVADIVEGLLRAAERVIDGQPVNIGTAEPLKIVDVVKLILELSDFSPRLEFDTSKPVGVFARAADLTHARQVLDWEPQTPLEVGLRRTVDWYCSTHDRDDVRANLERLLTER